MKLDVVLRAIRLHANEVATSVALEGYSPEVVAVMEVRNRVGEVIVKALEGVTGDALRSEATKACADIHRIIQRTEKT